MTRRVKWLKKILFIFIFCILGIYNISFAAECVNVRFSFDIKYKFDQPSDLSIGPNGDIYVVNGVENKIMAFNNSGSFKFAFGEEGAGKGQFKYPLGIDISDNGKIFIADSGNHRIQAFDLQGNFLYMFTVRSTPNENPPDPVDVLVSRIKDYLYISDNDNHKIKVYKQNGAYEFEWGKFGEDYGEFRYPGILAINQYNEVFVVDVLNTRVQKFDPFGKHISDIGSWGVLPGKFYRPKGVAIDKNGRVFISDSYMGVVQVFTDTGRFIGVVCENNKKKHFITPVGIFIDKNDRLLIAEMRENKITVVKILE